MSKHAKPTLIRFYRENQDCQLVLVNDWERGLDGYARFTLPATSPVAESLMLDGTLDVRVVVMDTEEVEFRVDRVDRWRQLGGWSDYLVRVQSLAARLRHSLPSDDYAIERFGVEK